MVIKLDLKTYVMLVTDVYYVIHWRVHNILLTFRTRVQKHPEKY